MPTITYDIASNLDQATASRAAASWAGVPTGTFNQGGGATDTFSKSLFGGTYTVHNSLMRWNTASLPDDATVTSAVLKIWVNAKGDPDNVDYACDYYTWGGSPAVSGDWEQSSSGDAIATIDATSLTTGAVNNLSFTGLTGISLSGYFGLRIAPKTTAQPTGDNFVDWASVEDGTTGHRPQLQVTYDVAVTSEAALRTAHTPVTWRT